TAEIDSAGRHRLPWRANRNDVPESLHVSANANEPAAFSLAPFLQRIAAREHLTADEAEAAFNGIMEGRVSPLQVAALLAALRAKGEAPQEVAGGVRALRRAMLRVAVDDGATVL